jgi:hypothetical protein
MSGTLEESSSLYLVGARSTLFILLSLLLGQPDLSLLHAPTVPATITGHCLRDVIIVDCFE